MDKKEEKTQCSTLLTVAGEDTVKIFNTFTFTSSQKDKFEPLVKKFEDYHKETEKKLPKRNVTYERQLFNTPNQGPTKSID